MAQLLDICEIRLAQTDWRAKVLVLEKFNRISTADTKRIQKMVFIDEKGDKVLGVIWNNDIQLFHDSLQPFNTYIIGGANVSKIKDEYVRNTPGITIQWTIGRSTYIRPLKDNEEPINYPALPYMSCSEIVSTVGTPARTDIFAVVVDVSPPKEKPVNGENTWLQEVIIIHQDLRPITLTLWGTFLEIQGVDLLEKKHTRPLILAKRLLPTTFAGLSLGTTTSSYITIDPDLPQAKEMRTWATSNEDAITKAMHTKAPENSHQLAAYNPTEPITQVNEIIPDRKNAWVEIELSIGSIQQQVTYTSCPGCMYTKTTAPNEDFYCFTCKSMQVTMIRSKINANITDSSGTIRATLYDNVAEQVLKHAPEELHAMSKQEICTLLHEIEQSLKSKQFRAEIRATKKKYKDNITRFTVQQLLPTTAGAESSKDQEDKENPGNESRSTKTNTPSTTEAADIDQPKTPPTKHTATDTTEQLLPRSPLKKLKLKEP